MKNDTLTDEQWFSMYTNVDSHQSDKSKAPQPAQEEILLLTDEITEVTASTQSISEMIAEELNDGEIAPLSNFGSTQLTNEIKNPKKEHLTNKTLMYLRCTNKDCTSTPRRVTFSCKLARECNACKSALKLGKE